MSPHIPALNEIVRQAFDDDPEYPDNPDGFRYMILFYEDYQGHGVDIDGNVALLLDKENAQEVRDLAEGIIDELDDGGADE